MNWYAVFVQTGAEESIKKRLDRCFDCQTLQCVVPKRRVPEKKNGSMRDAVKVLFPGYVLIRTKMNVAIYNRIKETPQVYNLLNFTNDRDKKPATNPDLRSNEESFFQSVPDEEISLLLKLIDDTGTLEYSKVLVENSQVMVVSGPLKGMEGIIRKINKHKKRAKIAVPFMDSEKLIDVGIEVLYSLSKSS